VAIGVVVNESSVALKEESTEGTYNAPTVSTEYIEVLSEGTEFNKNRELLERDTLSSTVETEAARVGMADVIGTMPVEFRASATAGGAPQALDLLLKSGLGGNRSAATQATSTGNTSTVMEFGVSPNFAKGDTVMVKEAGAYELRPISAVGATTITFPFALTNGAPSDGVSIEAVETYYHDTANSISLSAEHNVGDEIQQQVAGMRVDSISMENFTVGQIPQLNFGLGGLSLERVDSAGTATPDFTADALPPVALEACLFIGGTQFSYTEASMSIENSLSFLTDACLESGKAGSRITSQSVTFNCNPYSDDTSLTNWDAFNDNSDTNIFLYAYNPSSTAGEFSNAVCVWIPQGKIVESPFGDQDGISTDNLVIKAHKSAGNDSIFMSFI